MTRLEIPDIRPITAEDLTPEARAARTAEGAKASGSQVETREDDDGPLEPEELPTSDEDEEPEVWPCYICRMALNGPRQYRDHVTGKRHRKIKRLGRCFRAWKSALEKPAGKSQIRSRL